MKVTLLIATKPGMKLLAVFKTLRHSSLFSALTAWICSTSAHGQLVSSGLAVQNPEWEILVTDAGYADLALDRRPGFEGREYLSGEWAAAVFYAGGRNPTGPIWFQKQFLYPDWESNSDFGVEKAVNFANPQSPKNTDGFFVYQSIITNRDLRITITYEMLDSVTGVAQGTAPKSAGGVGSSITSSRYVFRQTYKITNISGARLTNLKFYQLLHGLETGVSTYDDRLYAGAMADYRYDNTQRGQSFSFDSRSREIVLHSDVIAFHARMAPSAWEVGYYGKKPTDSHVVGKPSVGVHLKVEADTLNGTDFFEPPEKRWVSGAQRFELGTLEAGASTTIDVLMSIQTSFQVRFSGVNVVVHKAQITGNKLIIDFQETIGGPIGFILRRSSSLTPTPDTPWEQVPLPYIINVPQPGWNRFEIPIDPTLPQFFFLVEPLIQN